MHGARRANEWGIGSASSCSPESPLLLLPDAVAAYSRLKRLRDGRLLSNCESLVPDDAW